MINTFDARFAAYLAVATLLIITPGPDTALVTRNALQAGRRAASATTLGVAAGSVVWAVASVFGLAALLEQSTTIFTLWKIGGAAYLGYLGLRSLIGAWRGDAASPANGAGPAAQPPARRLGGLTAFRQGLLNNLTNPKAGAIFATALPAFIARGDSPLRLALMLVAYEAILLTWLHLYGAVISRAGRSRFGARVRRWLEGASGAVLLALGVRLAFERR